jgi:hypothetical protein
MHNVITGGDPAHLKQTTMKKRYIALTAVGSVFGLAVLGFASIQADINECNSGKTKACRELAKTHWDSPSVRSSITAKGAAFFTAADEYKKRAEANAEDAKRFVVNRTNVAMLAFDCEKKHIRPFLKDPNSFRELDHSYTTTATHISVQVNYTATNGFGGRVQGNKVCTYTL